MRYTREVRARLLPFLATLVTVLGCGDGIGRPIVEQEPSASAAGTAGASGGFGGAGSGGTGSGGAGSGGADSGGAGSGGVGSGGYAGLPSFGGRGWRDPDGEGRGEPPPEVHCDGIDEWSEDSARRERFLFELLNAAREYGVACGSGIGTEASIPPVTMRPALQCAARLHSRDMFENDFFGHVGSDGSTIDERLRRAGYSEFGLADETIAEGEWGGEEMAPNRALDALFMTGGSECAPLVDPRFDAVGIGFFGDRWTLDFAGP